MLFIGIGTNFLGPKAFKWIFRLGTAVIFLDFFLNIIWLPIAVSKSYGFQSAEYVFTSTDNQTGALPAWNWMLSFFVTGGILVGFEASGHISEETQNASLTAARGIFSSAAVSAILGFPVVILFLFCLPSVDIIYNFTAPQPFVQIYALSLGRGGHIFMNIICIIGLILVSEPLLPIALASIESRTEYFNCRSCIVSFDMGCSPRRRSSILRLDLSGFRKEGAS
jgi:amino acid transporter